MKRRNSYYNEINPRSKFVYCRDSGGSYSRVRHLEEIIAKQNTDDSRFTI